jgi:hypothetical protein
MNRRRCLGILVLFVFWCCQLVAQRSQCTRIVPNSPIQTGTETCSLLTFPGTTVTETFKYTGECIQDVWGQSPIDRGPADPKELSGTGVCNVETEPILGGPCLSSICIPGNCYPAFSSFTPSASHPMSVEYDVQNYRDIVLPIYGTFPVCWWGNVRSTLLQCFDQASFGSCDPPVIQCDPNLKPCPTATCNTATGQWDPSTCPKQCDPATKPCANATCNTSTGQWDDSPCQCPDPKPCPEATCFFHQWIGPCIFPCSDVNKPCPQAICDVKAGKWDDTPCHGVVCPMPNPDPSVCRCDNPPNWNCSTTHAVCSDADGNPTEDCCNAANKPSCAQPVCYADGTWACDCDPATKPCASATCDHSTGLWQGCVGCGGSAATGSASFSESCCDPATKPPCSTEPTCHEDGTWTCDCDPASKPCDDAVCDQGAWTGCDCEGNSTCEDGSPATCVDGTFQCSCDQSPDQDGCPGSQCGECDPCNAPPEGCDGAGASCDQGSWCAMCGYC